MNRRTLLASGLAGTGLLVSGCLGGDEGDGIAPGGSEAEEGKKVIWNGEVLEITSVVCNDPGDDHEVGAWSNITDDENRIVFNVREYADDGYYRIQLVFSHEEGEERYRTNVDIGDGDVEFERGDTTSGTASLEPNSDLAEDLGPGGGEVEWDVSC